MDEVDPIFRKLVLLEGDALQAEREHCLKLARTLGHHWAEGDLADSFERARSTARAQVIASGQLIDVVLRTQLTAAQVRLEVQFAENKSLRRALMIMFGIFVLTIVVQIVTSALPFVMQVLR